MATVLAMVSACHSEPAVRLKGCGEDTRYRSVDRLVRLGDVQRRVGDLISASATYDRGLSALGAHYFAREVIDDTDLVLMSLKFDAPKTPSEGRIAAKGRILASRLRLYRDEADPEACL